MCGSTKICTYATCIHWVVFVPSFISSAIIIIGYSHIYASKLNNARVCSCTLELSHLYCCIVRIVPGMVLAGGI